MYRQHRISRATAATYSTRDFITPGFRILGINFRISQCSHRHIPFAAFQHAWIKRTVLALMWMEDAGCQATKQLELSPSTMSLRPQGTRNRSLSQHTNERPLLRGLAAHACVNKGKSQAPQAVEINAASAASRLHLCAKNTQSAEPSRHQSGLSVKSRRHRLLQRLLQATGLQEVSIPHHQRRRLHCKNNSGRNSRICTLRK